MNSPRTERVLKAPSRPKVLVGAGGLLLAAIGYAGLRFVPRIGWVLFGAGLFIAVVAAAVVASGRHYLAMDERGIRVVALARTVRYSWTDFAAFMVATEPLSGIKYVAFELTPEARQARPREVRLTNLTGAGDAGLPETYGMSAESLCELLAAEQRRHLGGHHVREWVH